jgi:hypothetical protein
MKKVKAAILLGGALFGSAAMASDFTAVISCGFNGSHINIAACFVDKSNGTDLKVTKNGSTKLYKAWELGNAGSEQGDGLHIDLPKSFSIKAQNAHKTLTLGIVITDTAGNEVYSDAVGKWGVINVGN